jgi:hypothetical protein
MLQSLWSQWSYVSENSKTLSWAFFHTRLGCSHNSTFPAPMKFTALAILLAASGLADARLGDGTLENDLTSADRDIIRIGVDTRHGDESTARDLQTTNSDLVRVMVGFKNSKGRVNAVAKSKKVYFEFSNRNVVTMTMSTADLASLQSDPTIA